MKSLTKEELVSDYLYNKVHGNPLPGTRAVEECDLYSETEEPWEIWDKYGGRELEVNNKNTDDDVLYLFTKLKKKSVNASRFSRRIGSNGGRWEGEDSAKNIYKDDVCVGFRRRFRYENPNSEQHGRWIMQQFSLVDNGEGPNDYVLCSLKKNENRSKKDRFKHIQSKPVNSQKESSTPQLCAAANSDSAKEELAHQCLDNLPLTCNSPSMTEEWDGAGYSDWILVFTKELLENETVSNLEDCEIEMLPNDKYSNIMGWERLS